MNIKHKLYNYIYEQHWTIGFIEQSISDIVNGNPYEIHYVMGMPCDRWFADPFIFDYNDNIIQVLVEEFCYKIRRGRIANLLIDRLTYKLLNYKIILDLPTHLSFPFIIRKEGKIYLAPENSESGSWTMYEYDSATDELKKVQVLSKEPLTDAIKTNLFRENFIFSTHLPSQNGNILSIYDEEGKLLQKRSFPTNTARNAGDWFRIHNKIYRPAQNCNGGYGKSVVIQEVKRTEEGGFLFENICEIISTHPSFTTGCHTFNGYKDLIVVDVHGYRRPKLVKAVNKWKGIKKTET